MVGWWFVGAAIYNVGYALLNRGLLVLHNVVVWQTQVALILVSLFVATTAGWVVGRHVYRAPGIVGAATVLLPGVLFILLASVRTHSVWILIVVFSALPAAVATIAARIAWRRRPSALRVGTGHM